MSMSDHIMQQVLQEFSARRTYSPEKRQNWVLLLYQSGRTSPYTENVTYLLLRQRGTLF